MDLKEVLHGLVCVIKINDELHIYNLLPKMTCSVINVAYLNNYDLINVDINRVIYSHVIIEYNTFLKETMWKYIYIIFLIELENQKSRLLCNFLNILQLI